MSCVDCVLAANMYVDRGFCVSTCGAGRQANENNTCVECDGECELKGIRVLSIIIKNVQINVT